MEIEPISLFAKNNNNETEKKDEKGMYSSKGKKLDTKYYCDNCKFYGHLRKDCWYLVGFPHEKVEKAKKEKKNSSKKPKTDSANQASTSLSSSLTTDELLQLKELLRKNNGKQIKDVDCSG